MNTNRETYLNKAVRELNTRVFKRAGYEVPSDVKVTCGWPSKSATSRKSRRIGECWPRSVSAAGVNEIFISPTIADSVDVLDILAHELIHAIDDCVNGHRAPFKRIALAIGLEGKMTSTTAGEELKATFEKIVAKLGEYPHATMDFTNRKKQSTRLLKLECFSCEAIWRMSRKWAELVECCPVCSGDSVECV